MQVSVEKTSELSRKMTVSVPDDVFQEKMTTRLKSLARDAKVHGFRPGKVPPHVIIKMYGKQVRSEIAENLVETTFVEALQGENLRPVGYPKFSSSDEAEGFEYTAEFEIYPEISLDGVQQIEVSRPVATVQEADVDGMIQKLRTQMQRWHIVDRAALEHDRVTIGFSGECEGKNFTDGRVENYTVKIGEKQMIAGFEENLIGLTVGAHKAFELSFPEDYGNEDLAGKVVQFEVDVISVEELVLPEVDDNFIKAYGINGTEDDFRSDIKANLESELERTLQTMLKNSVMNALHEKIQIAVPVILVDQEVERLMKAAIENAKSQNRELDASNLPRDVFEGQAKYRVAIGLILSEVMQKNNIKLDADKVRSAIEDMAKSYEQPSQIIDWYYSDENRLNDVQRMVLESQAIEWVVAQAKVSDQTISFSDAMSKQG